MKKTAFLLSHGRFHSRGNSLFPRLKNFKAVDVYSGNFTIAAVPECKQQSIQIIGIIIIFICRNIGEAIRPRLKYITILAINSYPVALANFRNIDEFLRIWIIFHHLTSFTGNACHLFCYIEYKRE